jgi:hypothetical protein
MGVKYQKGGQRHLFSVFAENSTKKLQEPEEIEEK